MTPALSLVLAASVALGAWLHYNVPIIIALTALVIAFGWRRPILLCAALGAITSYTSYNAWVGLDAPLPDELDGVVTLTTDVAPNHFGQPNGIAKYRGRLYLLRFDDEREQAAHASAGERLHVAGRVDPLKGAAAASLRRKHVAGSVSVQEVGKSHSGDLIHRSANGVRRCLERGASSLSSFDRALFLGFVLGDDRGQDATVVEDFRNTGLSHLLVVSGGNVAFLFFALGPILRRMGLGKRTIAMCTVLAFFGVLTRWEPSVLRAELMTSVTVVATFVGWPVSRVHVLCFAWSAALLVDPFLLGSLGFLLSFSACCGIAAFAAPIARLCRGPQWLCNAVGLTASAQLGLAPIEIVVFGGVPLVSIPANLMAEPVAGFLMTWGCTAGLVAGLAGGFVASVLHLPTTLALDYMKGVARGAASLELGSWNAPAAIGLAGVVLLVRAVGRHRLSKREFADDVGQE